MDSAPGTRLLLVRHAEAVCNVEDTFAGHRTCRGLTARGLAQCGPVAARIGELCAPGPDLVLLSSAMRRAGQTADAVAAGLGAVVREPARCGLCERHPGSLDGSAGARVKELTARDEVPADTEAPTAFLLRVRRELRRITSVHTGRTVVAVTHAGVINASFWALGNVSGRLPFRLQPDNGSITEWSTDGREPGVWWLRRYNDRPGRPAGDLRISAPGGPGAMA